MKYLILLVTCMSIHANGRSQAQRGIYNFENGQHLSVGEIEGTRFVILDSQVRGLRIVSGNLFEYGNSLGSFDKIEGRLRFLENECVWEHEGLSQVGVLAKFNEKPARFQNAKTKLDGTLILPDGNGPFPCIVFTHGSGPETREGSRDLAGLMALNGIAALIFDKRGTGGSSGKDWQDSFENYAGDAIAAGKFLKDESSIDAKHIGIYGHSQGGWVVPLALAGSDVFSFAILSAANAVTPVEQTLGAGDEECRLLGMDEASIAELHAFRKLKYEVAAGVRDGKEFNEKLLPGAESKSWFKLTGGKLPDSPFWKHNGFYDPTPALRAIHCPLLVLYGEYDISTNASRNLPLMKALIHTPDVRFETFKANHWMMQVDSKGFTKKQLPAITKFADGYLETLTQWTRSVIGW